MCKTSRILLTGVLLTFWSALGTQAATYVLDNGSIAYPLNASETTESRDNWFGNVFTAQGNATVITRVDFGVFTTTPNSIASVVIYRVTDPGGNPALGATRLYTQNFTPLTGDGTNAFLQQITLTTPVHLNTGDRFLVAILIRNVIGAPPNDVYPFLLDTSGVAAGTYWDRSDPNTFNLDELSQAQPINQPLVAGGWTPQAGHIFIRAIGVSENNPPVALCTNVVVSAGANCSTNASIDNGSYDPDGDPITISQVPPGPYWAGTHSVTLVVRDSKGASNACNALVTVVDTTPPWIACASNKVVECGGAWRFDPPVAFDNCSATNVAVWVVSTVTNILPGGGYTATRTWAAVDIFTNMATCSQTVRVGDTTPPMIVCASNKVVECGAAWNFDPPVAFDNCSATNVAVLVVSTVTNPVCGGSYTATRTWAAIDNATNMATCSQTVRVVDTTPPNIVCPSPITVEAQDEHGAVAHFVVTASDTCSPVALWATPPSGSVFPLGVTQVQATAMDACGNSNACAFTVTVLGAQGVKSNVLAELIALRATTTMDQSFATKFDYVIEHLQNSLNPEYWVDEIHLQPKGGNTALNEEKLAAKELGVIIASKNCPVEPAVLQGLINRILKADRLLAMISIEEAAAAGLNAKKIAEDLAEVAKGDEKAAAGNYANAIEHYRNAWRHAVQLRLQVAWNATGGAVLQFVGDNTKSYVIEVSSDMVNWTALATCKTDAAGDVEFVDADASKRPLRFYRIVER